MEKQEADGAGMWASVGSSKRKSQRCQAFLASERHEIRLDNTVPR